MNKFTLLIFLSISIFASCNHEKEGHDEGQKEAHGHHGGTPQLEVTNPILKDTNIVRTYVSQIHASKHIELRALERGYLQSINVDEGQYVKKGHIMFQTMPNVYEAELQMEIAEAKAAEIEYQNTLMLAEKKVVSANELALAKAHLDKANAEVNLAQVHLGFTAIKAPFSGIMDHLEAQQGSLLEEGEMLTTLSDNSKMWVYFNVPETEYLDYVTSDKSTRIKKVDLQLANGKYFDQEGIIEVIEGEFDNETGNIEFRATFPNPKSILRHGETGNVKMKIPYVDALIIPQKATFEILDKKFVFVLNKDNKLEQRKIEIAAEIPHLYIVSSGITAEDKVLIDGLRKVKNGDEIVASYISPEKVLEELHLHAE